MKKLCNKLLHKNTNYRAQEKLSQNIGIKSDNRNQKLLLFDDAQHFLIIKPDQMRHQLPITEKFMLFTSGYYGSTAIICLLVGIFFSIILLRDFDWKATMYLNHNVQIGEGKIIDVFETNTTINEETIYGYEYIFYSHLGDMNNISFTKGFQNKIGDIINVEYHSKCPDINRIEGMTNTMVGPLAAIPFIPLLLGVGILIYNINIRFKHYRLIVEGDFIKARLVDVSRTLWKVNNRRVYKLTFKFTANNGGAYQVTTKTHLTRRLADESEELLIYNRNNPNEAVMVDRLPRLVSRYIKRNWCQQYYPSFPDTGMV